METENTVKGSMLPCRRGAASACRNCGMLVGFVLVLTVYSMLHSMFEEPCMEGVVVDPEVSRRYRAQTDMSSDNIFNLVSDVTRQRSRKDDVNRVIIHGAFRTGSTFTSDFFLKHEGIYYLYEPFYLVPFKDVSARLLDLFRDLFDCSFRKIWGIAESNPKFHGTQGQNLLRSWRHKMFCWKHIEDRQCPRRPLEDFRRECMSYKTRVIKSIRISEVEQVRPLMEEGYKVVQLIRDPRGMMNSRAALGKLDLRKINEQVQFFLYSEARIYCTNLGKDIFYVNKMFNENVTSFTDNYMVARYEDLAARPSHMMEKLYKFIDADPDENLLDWIDETEGRISGRVRSGGRRREDKMLTYRQNSTATSEKWRAQIPMEVVSIVQDACGDVMRKLGYVLVNNEQELRDTRRSLNLPFVT